MMFLFHQSQTLKCRTRKRTFLKHLMSKELIQDQWNQCAQRGLTWPAQVHFSLSHRQDTVQVCSNLCLIVYTMPEKYTQTENRKGAVFVIHPTFNHEALQASSLQIGIIFSFFQEFKCSSCTSNAFFFIMNFRFLKHFQGVF